MKRGTAEGTGRRTASRRRFLRGVAAAGLLGTGLAAPASAQEGTPTATPTTTYELGAQVSAWIGQKPDAIADRENPTLRLVAGRTYTISWVNLDGQQHQLRILTEAGESVAESDVVSTQGGTGAVEFEATERVATYRSSIHTSMRGRIEIVRPGARTTAGTSTATPGNATRTTGAPETEPTTAADGAGGGRTGASTTEETTAGVDDATTAASDTAASNGTAGGTTDSVATTIGEGGETFGAGGASSRGQPGFGVLAGLAGLAGLLGLRRFARRDD